MRNFLLLLAVVLFAAAPPTSRAVERLDDKPISFTGTWKTIAGGTHQYTVILKQTDNEVTGTYSPGNGKIFDGVVVERKVTFKWSQDGGYEGTGEFTLAQDGKGFTGSSTALKPQQFTNTWNTYEPEPVSFAGIWETTSAATHSISLTIVQSGNKVTGLYPGNNGKIEGTVTGNVLRFKWESDGGSGSGRFVMDESGVAFSGTYNSGDNPDDGETTWNGVRVPGKGGKGPQASLAGEWVVILKSETRKMVLRQVGDQVTGFFMMNDSGYATYHLKEAKVVGNTFHFRFVRSATPNSPLSGELTLDEGGKSFKGKLNDNPITGTFVKPVQQ